MMKIGFAGSTFIQVATAEEVLRHVVNQDFDLLVIDEEMPLPNDPSKHAMLGNGREMNPGCIVMVPSRVLSLRAAPYMLTSICLWFVLSFCALTPRHCCRILRVIVSSSHVVCACVCACAVSLWFAHTAATGSQAISEIRRRESVEHNKNSNMNNNSSRRLRIVSCTSRSSEPVVSSRIMAAGADLLWGKPFPGRTEMYNTLSKLFA